MKKYKITLYLLVGLFALSCEKESLTLPTNTADLPVVEAYLAVGQQAVVTVKKQAIIANEIDSSDQNNLSISGLQIEILNNGNSFSLIESSTGTYKGDSTFIIQANQEYLLSFEYNGNVVRAQTITPSKPTNFKASRNTIKFETSSFPPSFPDPISLTWDDNTNERFYQISIQNIESNPQLLDFGGASEDRPQRPTPPEQMNTYELRARDFVYRGTHRVVLFSVNPEYVSFTQTSTDASAQSINEPYTNIVNGLGIFTGVGADTLFVEATD